MTIAVAYLPTDYGEAALDVGISEAKLRGEPLVVVNASTGSSLVDPKYATAAQLEHLDRRLSEAGVEHDVVQTIGPDVAEEILAVAQKAGASLVVVGMRRRSPVGKLMLGSVSQRILLDSSVPVLAVRA